MHCLNQSSLVMKLFVATQQLRVSALTTYTVQALLQFIVLTISASAVLQLDAIRAPSQEFSYVHWSSSHDLRLFHGITARDSASSSFCQEINGFFERRYSYHS
jgi:hypothetical protein